MNKRVRKKLGMYGNENPRGNGGFFLLKKELTAAGVSGIIWMWKLKNRLIESQNAQRKTPELGLRGFSIQFIGTA